MTKFGVMLLIDDQKIDNILPHEEIRSEIFDKKKAINR